MARREFERRHQLPFSLPGLAYHYTNLSSLHAIVESQDLWLTDYAYLNDAAEISHGLELSKSVLKDLLGNTVYADSSLLTALHAHVLQSSQDVVVKSVREFLAEKGYRNIAVRQSSIPFR